MYDPKFSHDWTETSGNFAVSSSMVSTYTINGLIGEGVGLSLVR